MLLSTINEAKKPLRNRVEVFATKDGKVYGGFYKDGSFGTFGGGTDGEDLKKAARREFEEEAGYKLTNLRQADVKPVIVIWKTPKSKKQEDRIEKYRGTKTWYFIADLGEKTEKAKGEDGESSLTNIGLKEIDDVIEKLKNTETDDEGLIKQYKARIEVLEEIWNNN